MALWVWPCGCGLVDRALCEILWVWPYGCGLVDMALCVISSGRGLVGVVCSGTVVAI